MEQCMIAKLLHINSVLFSDALNSQLALGRNIQNSILDIGTISSVTDLTHVAASFQFQK